jgi:hypothetical protein
VTSISSEDEADYKIVVHVFCTNSAANNLELVLAAVSRASFLSHSAGVSANFTVMTFHQTLSAKLYNFISELIPRNILCGKHSRSRRFFLPPSKFSCISGERLRIFYEILKMLLKNP